MPRQWKNILNNLSLKLFVVKQTKWHTFFPLTLMRMSFSGFTRLSLVMRNYEHNEASLWATYDNVKHHKWNFMSVLRRVFLKYNIVYGYTPACFMLISNIYALQSFHIIPINVLNSIKSSLNCSINHNLNPKMFNLRNEEPLFRY